jgi:DNA topoisomerase-6 subunit B
MSNVAAKKRGAKPPAGQTGEASVKKAPPGPPADQPKLTAEEMAGQQREISVAEFFTKNRHLLGFDNPSRALLTTVKEAVDNALDACEEAGYLPDVSVVIRQKGETRFTVSIEDNGPGIVHGQIPRIFGKLLYGSKFHRLRQSRGQQGIGISAAALYAQLTTGKGITITSRTAKGRPAHHFELFLDTAKNEPHITKDETVAWDPPHGTKVELELEARYVKGEKGVDAYLRQTALANPHVSIRYLPPDAAEGAWVTYERATRQHPPDPKQIKPHPYGVELGMLIKMLQGSKARRVKAALQSEFSRVSGKIAGEICAKAQIPPESDPKRIARQQAEALYAAIQNTRIMAPPSDCVVPIGQEQLLKALKANVEAEFYTAVTRPPAVYRGNPFVVETGIAFGIKDYPAEEAADVLRFANRVPLLYQPGACAINKAVVSTDWRNYDLQQPKNSPPIGPMLIMVHMGSVWVPFTSEAKEAVAHYPEIIKEMRLALQEAGRQMSAYLSRRAKAEYELKRRSIFELYIEELSKSLDALTGCGREKVRAKLRAIAAQLTKKGEI